MSIGKHEREWVDKELAGLQERNAKLVAELELAKADIDNLRHAVSVICTNAIASSAKLVAALEAALLYIKETPSPEDDNGEDRIAIIKYINDTVAS